VLLEITYTKGVAHGPYQDFWSSGRVSLKGQYSAGEMDGEWLYYDWNTGELREVLRFVGGRQVAR
jgi:antitoxin component YwqK of YwqJK toxin-antitoxin module